MVQSAIGSKMSMGHIVCELIYKIKGRPPNHHYVHLSTAYFVLLKPHLGQTVTAYIQIYSKSIFKILKLKIRSDISP